MKKTCFIVMAMLFLTTGCASEGYNTQKGAAIGAVGGALVGQAIGHNTAGTLVGAAGGALVGAVAGNAVDQANEQQRRAQASPAPAYVPAPPTQEAPPGKWVEVPGGWVGGKWVPAHRAWVPTNPEETVSADVPPPPAYAPSVPPDVVVIPGTYVYFVPGIDLDIFFYHGRWYRSLRGHWYSAVGYGGPWVYVNRGRMPHALTTLPPGWRNPVPGYHRIPHEELQKNWQKWEQEGHRDRR